MDVNASRLQHRIVLLKIGQQLTQSDLEELLYLCEEVLSESVTQKITSATSLFRELQHRAYLAPNHHGFVKERLLNIGRDDLANMLTKNEDENLEQTFSNLTIGDAKKSNDQKKILLSLSNQLRVEDVEKMAYLCSCEAKEGIQLIMELEKNGWIKNNNYDYISSVLMEIGRCDLAGQFKASTPQ